MKQTIRRFLFLVALTAAASGGLHCTESRARGRGRRSLSRSENNRARWCTWRSRFTKLKINNRREFESIWHHLLKFKSKGGTLTMHAIPNKKLGPTMKAGGRIISPLAGTKITPNGKSYPPNTKTQVTVEGVLTIGPP
ncbi:MAG: hypothetical protein CBC62_10440 [Opitutia bacterium TMED102]|nr:MAG: hypothetical protein CBC62_10440 [Opitutae bacterium TMED102]